MYQAGKAAACDIIHCIETFLKKAKYRFHHIKLITWFIEKPAC